jgi:peptide/nickel transport system substrate-binding protein
VVPDAVVRALEMRRGSVDLVVNDLPPDSLAYFGRGGYRLDRHPGANYRYIGIHCARRPLDRPDVRRALAMAVDRAALLRFVQNGFGRPAAGLLCPENWAVAPDLASPPYDPEGAKRLLASAGYGPGRPLRLTYKTSADKVSRRIAVSVQEYLRRVGVDVEIRSMEWAAFYADVQRGDFDLFGLVWVGITDPDALRLRFSSRAFPPEGLNRGRYSNGEVDHLLEAAAAEGDRSLRRDFYLRAQRVLAEEVPYIPLWHPDNVAVSRSGLERVTLSPDGSFRSLATVGWEGRP